MPTHIFLTVFTTAMIPAAVEALVSGLDRRRVAAWVGVVAVICATLFPIVTGTNAVMITVVVALTVAIDATVVIACTNRNAARTVTTIITVLIAVFVLGNPSLVHGFNRTFVGIARLVALNPLVASLDPHQIHVAVMALAGMYLAAIESNHAIALILKSTNLMPSPTDAPAASAGAEFDEPARGRVIGYLERTIVFLLVFSGNVSAIGLVLVAKGIARFQQLDDRGFAEYFLIGTLMSVLVATLVATVFRAFL